MRIAITGAQSTGKSTLLRFLKQDDDLKGFEFIQNMDKISKKLQSEGMPFSYNDVLEYIEL